MTTVDMKLIGSAAGLIFVAGGAWWNLHAVSGDVAEIKVAVQTQKNDLVVHTASEHSGSADRIKRIETAQQDLANDMKRLLANQSAICERTNARCR